MDEARTESGDYQVTEDQRKRAATIVGKIDQQLQIEKRMEDLYPRRQYVTYQAQLTYWRSAAQISLLEQGWNNPSTIQQYLRQVDQAKSLYMKSLRMSGSYSNREDLDLDETTVRERIDSLEREMFSLISRLEGLRGAVLGPGGD